MRETPAARLSVRNLGLTPKKRSPHTSFAFKRNGYAIGFKFFLFSFLVFFFFYWFLAGSRTAWFVLAPCLIVGFGSALLLYALFSLVGLAKPLVEVKNN
ncbi:MAG: hypothetical protein QW343_02895 [Candidatus Norongarragalinales archaeon]